MTVSMITKDNMKDILEDQSIVFVTKKTKRETHAHVIDVYDDCIVAVYTNKFNEPHVKSFSTEQYDFYLA